MFFVLVADWYRLWRAMGAPGKRKQAVSEIALESEEEALFVDNLPVSLVAPDPAQGKTLRLPATSAPPPKLDPETRRKRQALLKEAEARRADLSAAIRTHRNSLQRRHAPHTDLEDFVHGIEQIAEQAEADPAWFLRFEEFCGAEVYQTWRQMQSCVPPALARRLVRAYVRLAQVTQRNGASLEQQWAFYLLAYALDPRLDGTFRQAAQVADQLHLRTPEAQTLRLLARRPA